MILALPASHAFGSTSGRPGTWSAFSRSAFATSALSAMASLRSCIPARTCGESAPGLGRGLKSCPEQDSDELNGGKEVGGVLFEACGDAAGMFELVEEALD